MESKAQVVLDVIQAVQDRDVETLESEPEKTWLGTWGPSNRPKPSGERFESDVLALYEVRDGKFATAQMFHYDTAALTALLDRARQKP